MATLQVNPSGCPQPRLLAVGLNAGAVLLLGGLTVLASLQAPAGRPGLDVVVVALGVLLVPLTLRRPVPGTLALAVLAALSTAGTPALSLGLLHVAWTHRLRTTVWAAVAAVAASAVQGWWRPAGGLSYGWWLALIVAAYAALLCPEREGGACRYSL